MGVGVTSPGGQARTISGQANSIGYFPDPAGDFVVGEPGIWTVVSSQSLASAFVRVGRRP